MKKKTFVTAALALFFMASCSSENTQQDNTATMENHDGHEHHEGMAHGDMPAQTAVVVETPSFGSVPEPMQRNLSQLLDQYMQIKDALVSSDASATKNAANTLLASANSMPIATLQSPDQKQFAEQKVEEVKKAAGSMAGAGDLAAQRNNLEQLSEAVFALTKAFGAANGTLYYQHCPMALNNQGAYWLSSNSEIRNPYFGDSMLKCGSNEEIYQK